MLPHILNSLIDQVGFPGGNPPINAGDVRYMGSILGSGRSPGGGHGKHSVFLPGESHGQWNMVDYSP